jgi:hypothetical protein
LLPADICDAEREIYARTDFHRTETVRQAMVRLKNLYIGHAGESRTVREHILALADAVIAQAQRVRAPRGYYGPRAGRAEVPAIDRELRAFERKFDPVVPLDWELPEEIVLATFVVEKYYEPSRDRTEFRFGLFGGLTRPGIVESLRVTRYPNEAVLDKHDAGAWHETLVDRSRQPVFSLSGTSGASPIEEGLYLVTIQIHGKAPVNGWFFLSRITPSAIPVVQTPALNETFATPTPVLRWLDFHSPQFRPFERRKRRIAIQSVESPDVVDWTSSVMNPEPAVALTVGAQTGELRELRAGAYRFHVSFEERWLVGGGFFIGRTSTTVVPFRVGIGG